jgi:peptidoglycan/xylan/chitin deacetylase (PgdA/CDA1 family)
MVVSRKRRAIRDALRALSRLAARRHKTRSIVLMYHAIGDSAHCIKPDIFEAHMIYLRAHARVISLDAMLNAESLQSVAPLTCAISFDDGYAGAYEHAYPILRQYGFQAVVYVTTSAIDTGGAKRSFTIPGFFPGEATLTWPQVQEMSRDGMTIGSHLCNHVDMTMVGRDVGMEELTRSKEIISQRLGAPCMHFAYPFGLFNRRTTDWVRACGYQSAVTIRHSVVSENPDPFTIPRMGLAPADSFDEFVGMLRGDLDYLLVVRKVRQILSNL